MKNYLQMILQQRRPGKFLVAQLLKRSGLCRFFSIPQDGYRLTFYPSNLSTTLWIDPHDRDEDQQFIRRCVRPGDIVIDVGANIGFTVLAAALAAGPTGKVVAFEPHPRICSYLRGNLARNHVANVKVINAAVGDQTGVITFSDTKRDDMNRPQANGGPVETPVVILDECLIDEPRIDLLKIDVEGYECFVLKGAKSVLARAKCVYFEVSEENFKTFHYTTKDLLDIFLAAGLFILRVDGEIFHNVPRDYVPSKLENLIAVRSITDFAIRTGFRTELDRV